jgi:hypothetical protein
VDLTPRTTSYEHDRRDWLGSEHGTDATETITINLALFTAATHFPSGFLKSGEPLGKVTATGLYGPYDNGASDGREVCVGLLFSAQPVPAGVTTGNFGEAMLTHGRVINARLPRTVDAAGITDLAGRIRVV